MYHHNTIRKYTAALLDFFNGLEIQYNDSASNSIVRSIPIQYSSKEKARLLDNYTSEQLKSGNMNALPRASLSLSTMVKTEQRVMNKNTKIGTKSNTDTFDFMYNSVPYEFTYELAVLCRGMNEATQIIEQLAPKFNPVLNIDIWDANNLNEPTRVPVRLLDIGIETDEYDEYTSNLVTVSIGLSITGNLYSPIQSVQRVKEFKMSINEDYNDGTFGKKIIDNWDVASSGSPVLPGTSTQVQDTIQYPPSIIDITSTSLVAIGTNNLTVIWDDLDNKLTEMVFDWSVIQGTGTIIGDLDTAVLTVTASETVEVQCVVTDPFGNFTSLSKTYNT